MEPITAMAGAYLLWCTAEGPPQCNLYYDSKSRCHSALSTISLQYQPTCMLSKGSTPFASIPTKKIPNRIKPQKVSTNYTLPSASRKLLRQRHPGNSAAPAPRHPSWENSRDPSSWDKAMRGYWGTSTNYALP